MPTIFILLAYYWLITFSIIGYGILFNNFFLKNTNNIGFIGIYGIFSLTLISYLINFFLPLTESINVVILSVGLINFLVSIKRDLIRKNIDLLLIVFTILILFILTAKNHDDFSYYHFPYIHLLTENSNMIGLGNFNHGFRTHSSIFYLTALFNLPFSNFYLFNLSPVFFMGFANIILYKRILSYLDQTKTAYLLYLSLFSLIFINIFFYRLGEHGTDRSAMILIFILTIELLNLINQKRNVDPNYFLRPIILTTLIISLKTFYILYCLLFIPVVWYFKRKNISLMFFFQKSVSYVCLGMILLLLTVNFFNSGCLLYPVKFTCFESFSWSIPLNEVEAMNNWYQQWAKAGANPNFRVENPEVYIDNFNWVSNWVNMYFFNKVSDFLLGLVFLSLVMWFIFFSKKTQIVEKPQFWLIYSIFIFLTLQWFYVLPALRYGGYHLIALLFFIPFSIFLNKYSISPKLMKKKIFLIILLTIIIFVGRNISRINKEHHIYNYNILNNAFYSDYQQNLKIYNNITHLQRCLMEDKSSICENTKIKVKFLNNRYIYYRHAK